MRNLLLAAATLLIQACALGPGVPEGEACVAKSFVVTDGFPGARRGTCAVMSSRHVRLDIRPENEPPINDSPWYAFRIDAPAAVTAKITLRYENGHHRYRPKLSDEGSRWRPLDPSQVTESADGRIATFEVELDGRPVYVAAQELVTPPLYDDWSREIAARTGAGLAELGLSGGGRPIYALDTGPQARDVLFLTGRQHPPEVSGAFAFFSFTEALLADTRLARQFRSRYRIVAIPLLNPDGVDAGHWRNNLGGVDLNRDWGPFTQPETRLVRDLLDELDEGGYRVQLFLDFHSTKRNVFYTQNEDFVTDPPQFMKRWLERAALRIDDYEFANSGNPVSAQPNSKNYMYRRYGIPTATYEVGDETDRQAAMDAARVFAEELMTLLLCVDD